MINKSKAFWDENRNNIRTVLEGKKKRDNNKSYPVSQDNMIYLKITKNILRPEKVR